MKCLFKVKPGDWVIRDHVAVKFSPEIDSEALSPIRITRMIMSLNGFKDDELETKDPEYKISLSEYSQEATGTIWTLKIGSFLNYKICYVHEFQQWCRQFGLDSIADNFEMKNVVEKQNILNYAYKCSGYDPNSSEFKTWTEGAEYVSNTKNQIIEQLRHNYSEDCNKLIEEVAYWIGDHLDDIIDYDNEGSYWLEEQWEDDFKDDMKIWLSNHGKVC